MKYIVTAILLLTVSYSTQDAVQTQNLNQTVNGLQQQNVSKSEIVKPTQIENSAVTSSPGNLENGVTTKTNLTANGTAPQNPTTKTNLTANGTAFQNPPNLKDSSEPPVIIDGSTYPVPGTNIPGNGTIPTTPPPSPTTTIPTPTTNKTTPVTTPTTSVTPTATTPTPTTQPQPQPTAAPSTPSPTQHRGFDGPSFVGGIVLALGLVAIGFVAFKFYKARTELNYHTL